MFGWSFEGIAETHFLWNGEMEREGHGNWRSLVFEALMMMMIISSWKCISWYELS